MNYPTTIAPESLRLDNLNPRLHDTEGERNQRAIAIHLLGD